MLLLGCHLARQEGTCFQEMKTNMDDPAFFNDSLCALNPFCGATLRALATSFGDGCCAQNKSVSKSKRLLEHKAHRLDLLLNFFSNAGQQKQIQIQNEPVGFVSQSVSKLSTPGLGLDLLDWLESISKLSRPGKGLG